MNAELVTRVDQGDATIAHCESATRPRRRAPLALGGTTML
jgi:hypothetical protein